MVAGQYLKNSGLPGYNITFNIAGRRVKRAIVPQNPNKKYQDGNLKPTAISARSGNRIAWIMTGEKGATDFLFKYENGVITRIEKRR
jgi:hypothetical protein